ncbi:MAG: hypothetical protein ABH830_00225 [Patescibacteria group bacterium]
MSKNNLIQNILNDLYQYDPELKKEEKHLIKIINNLIKTRPNTKFDENFANQLRAQLMAKVEELKENKSTTFKFWPLLNLKYMKNLTYAAVGLTVIALLLVSTFIYLNQGEQTKLAYDKMTISQVGNNAFGSLKSTGPDQAAAVNQDATLPSKAAGLGGGGGGQALTEGSIIGMPAPDYTNYNYVYKGGPISLTETEMPVYKKIIDKSSGQNLVSNFTKVNFGLFNLGKFSNPELQNFSLIENRDYGYILYFSLSENLISIFPNWEKWPRPESACRDEKCFEQYRLKISDIPADENIIAIADRFIKEYEINTANYGEAQVNKQWLRAYQSTPDKSMAYVPETITIVYPLIINNQTIYDEGGNVSGLQVEVNIKYNKVSSVYGLSSSSYESSNYQIENDNEKIITLAEQGGLNRLWYNPEASEAVDLELGTPTKSLIRYWHYDQEKNLSSEIFIPALTFPINNLPEQTPYFYQTAVVVPLIKEVIEERFNNDGGTYPMPLLEEKPTSSINPHETTDEITDININE